MQLNEYMSGSIRNIMARAYRSVLTNPREARFVLTIQKAFSRSEKRRAKVKIEEGLDVPPFLISSISTTCNLSCKGCYARANGIANDPGKSQRSTMSPEEWKAVKAVCIVFAQGDFLYSIPDAFCCVENMVLAANGQAPS